MSNDTADLSTVTSQELINELRGRCEVFACVFRLLGSKLPDEWCFSDGGEEDRVLALLIRAQNELLNPAPDDDEDDDVL